MSMMIVDQDQQKEKPESLLGDIKQVSAREESVVKTNEQRTNDLLDFILSTKKHLKDEAKDMTDILKRVDEITWFRNVTPELLGEIKGLIEDMFSLHKVMVEVYVQTSRFFAEHRVKKDELKLYKSAVDDLRESAEDLNDIFFLLPHDAEFQNLCKELNDL